MKINYTISILIMGVLVMSGCQKFLDVTPRATVSDEKLFQDESGFEQAMNGVYHAISSQTLYGDNLTLGYLSALAKNYTIANTSHRFFRTNTFNYENEGRIANIWNSTYSAIAALNNILSQIDKRKNIFSGDNYAIIKGEALALRAFLHFDLFRLYGQRYQSNPDAKAIPYRTAYTLKVKAAHTSRQVIDSALNDLSLAEALLAVDPIRTQQDIYRKYRMNYYAVLGLKARIYNLTGEAANAVKYANMVIDSNLFPFIEQSAISATSPGRKDRLFTPELVFALRVKDIGNWADGSTGTSTIYFRYSISGLLNYTLTTTEANYRDLFEGATNPTDYRYQHLFETDDLSTNGGSQKYPSKYWQTWTAASGESSRDRKDRTVPLIRLTEMYYILANQAPTIQNALAHLNTVRQNRGIINELTVVDIDDESLLLDEITKEYQKEFYAEGQTFFWYKQIGATSIKFHAGPVVPENYIFPIPLTELEYNPSYD